MNAIEPDISEWDPWRPDEAARLLEGVDAPWYVAGGWAIDLSSSALVGFDPATGHEVVRRALDAVSHFASPSAAPGCLFVPTDRTVTAFCLPGRS